MKLAVNRNPVVIVYIVFKPHSVKWSSEILVWIEFELKRNGQFIIKKTAFCLETQKPWTFFGFKKRRLQILCRVFNATYGYEYNVKYHNTHTESSLQIIWLVTFQQVSWLLTITKKRRYCLSIIKSHKNYGTN